MPELSDDMYCSQQIMVPPMFPYLLRQYAKAAIRSQPSDLLRWSTAYFRCLSLNLPPPVKPRLEYPIPKDYDGITPGWLKALLYQFQNNTHVDFKLLWDRWIGACLNHHTLIKILCLGGFTDPMAVPLLRFIALCVAFLCENLTQTMILICEVLTEEPEGGSAMITVEVFIDLYKYLAAIDASKDQILINRYFTDALLDLLEKKAKKITEAKPPPPATPEKEPSLPPEIPEEEEKQEEEAKDEISCPDLTETIEDTGTLDETPEDDEDNVLISKSTDISDGERKASAGGKKRQTSAFSDKSLLLPVTPAFETSEEQPVHEAEAKEEGQEEDVREEEGKDGEETTTATAPSAPSQVPSEKELMTEPSTEMPPKVSLAPTEEGDLAEVLGEIEGEMAVEFETRSKSLRESAVAPPSAATQSVSDINTYLKELQGEEYGEGVPTAPLLEEEESFQGFGIYGSVAGEEEELMDEEFELEEVFVEKIPGIGSIVPAELVDAVVDYMKNCAKNQHGMVMPRNVRHYSCPPLEVVD